MTTYAVQPDSEVLLYFDLKLADRQLADSTRRENKPALFRLGDDSLSTELEQALLGLHQGDRKTFSLAPEAAFGPSNPDLIQFYSRRNFIETGVPEVAPLCSSLVSTVAKYRGLSAMWPKTPSPSILTIRLPVKWCVSTL